MDENEKLNDGEGSLPKACIDRIINNATPSGINISKDARLLVMNYAISFIHFLSIGSYHLSEKEKKKTIVPDHVYKALEKFGFAEFIEGCKETFDEYQSLMRKKPSKKNTLKNSGLSMEELLLQQKDLFENAKIEMKKNVEESSEEEE